MEKGRGRERGRRRERRGINEWKGEEWMNRGREEEKVGKRKEAKKKRER